MDRRSSAKLAVAAASASRRRFSSTVSAIRVAVTETPRCAPQVVAAKSTSAASARYTLPSASLMARLPMTSVPTSRVALRPPATPATMIRLTGCGRQQPGQPAAGVALAVSGHRQRHLRPAEPIPA